MGTRLDRWLARLPFIALSRQTPCNRRYQLTTGQIRLSNSQHATRDQPIVILPQDLELEEYTAPVASDYLPRAVKGSQSDSQTPVRGPRLEHKRASGKDAHRKSHAHTRLRKRSRQSGPGLYSPALLPQSDQDEIKKSTPWPHSSSTYARPKELDIRLASQGENPGLTEPFVSAEGAVLLDDIVALANQLMFHVRQNNIGGVRTALKDLLDRQIGVPVTGPSAEKVWEIFLNAAIIDTSGFEDLLVQYAHKLQTETGLHYHRIHQCLVGHRLRFIDQDTASRSHAVHRHISLVRHDLATDYDIVALVEDVIHSNDQKAAFELWKEIYLAGPFRKLYDPCMRQLRPGSRLYEAFQELLMEVDVSRSGNNDQEGIASSSLDFDEVERHDQPENVTYTPMTYERQPKPTSSNQSPNLVTSLLSFIMAPDSDSLSKSYKENHKSHTQPEDIKTSSRTKTQKARPAQHENRYAGPQKRQEPVLTRSNMNTILGDVHGITEKRLGDDFCARILATHMFPLTMSIASLKLLGVEGIGPVSIREIARRAGDHQKFEQMLSRVEGEGISVRESVFLRLLRQLGTCKDTQGLEALLNSDQHPENYDDLQLQEQLLRQFQREKQWPQVHITLQVLALHGKDTRSKAWNALIQEKAASRDLAGLRHCVHTMRLNHVEPSAQVLSAMWALLPRREPGKHEEHVRNAGDIHDLVTSVYMQAMNGGRPISHKSWKELLTRYGHSSRTHKLTRCVLWLGDLYARKSRASPSSTSAEPLVAQEIALVFEPRMQKAIVWWSWRTAILGKWQPLSSGESHNMLDTETKNTHAHDRVQPWAKGIATLRHLEEIGISVNPQDVRDAIRQQLWMIFGPGFSTREINNTIAARNELSIAQYVKHVNEIWPGLLDLPASLLAPDTKTHADLLVAIFGQSHSLSRKSGTQVDIASWAARLHPLAMTKGFQSRQIARRHHLRRSLGRSTGNAIMLKRLQTRRTSEGKMRPSTRQRALENISHD